MAVELLLFEPAIVGALEQFKYIFPFLLSLAIMYSIINFASGESKRIPKSANGLISIIISFFVMLYTSSNPSINSFFEQMSGSYLIIGSGLLFLIVILGIVGFKFESLTGENSNFKWAVVLFIILVGFLIFLGAGGSKFLNLPSFTTTSDFWNIIFFVVILAVVFLFLTKSGDDAPAAGGAHH